ncbi:C2H2 transcription factor [Fusarium beomiforme]|uniref:C2H2 transcription factor n=1 Tax=Fusarium beomiforme TaxID=44412 RepID=A0A9P5AGH3_9HYPO|nr:C2H2 transcription factor [Fusarium beomiforme]
MLKYALPKPRMVAGRGADEHVTSAFDRRKPVAMDSHAITAVENNTSSQGQDELWLDQDPGSIAEQPTVVFGDDSLFDYLGNFNSVSDMLDGSDNQDWLDFMNLAAGHFPIPSADPRTHLDNYSFHFLDNFTRRTGLINSFDCGTFEQRVQVVACSAETAALGFDSGSSLIDPALLETLDLEDPHVIQSRRIIPEIKELITVKPRNSVIELEWSVALEQACLNFFSPTNLRKFLALFWHIWHPNCNYIHRPTFDVASAKSMLVASMVVMGASFSPDKSDNEQAKMWFNSVEEMVFTDIDFCDHINNQNVLSPNPVKNIPKIQALQAAFIVCTYQGWEGTETSRRRTRRSRYSTVTSTVRDLGIIYARHRDYSNVLCDDFDWKDFAAREQLIRTILWIYLLDHAFVIFNNLPPRMVIREMSMHMAFPEAAFQAETSEECAQELQIWHLRSTLIRNITFREVVESFCRDTFSDDMRRCFADLGPLNLFAVVSGKAAKGLEVDFVLRRVLAFHALIFQHQNSFGGYDQLQSVRNALENWKSAWETYSDEFSFSPPHVMVDRNNIATGDLWRRIAATTTALVAPALDGRFELQEVHLNPIQPDEAVVEIHASGVCHTDLSCASGKLPCAPNAVLGHEAYCYSFNDYNFGGKRPDGSTAMSLMRNGKKEPIYSTFFGQSSFAARTIVHRSSLVKVPQETPLDLFAPLGCGIQTGVGAVFNTLDVKPGSSLAVFGVGSVGLAAVMAGKARKAGKIIAIDLQPERLQLAKELGATDGVLGPDQEHIIKSIKDICPPLGVDYAVDCTGVPSIVETMVAALGMRGRAATVGAPGGESYAKINIMNHLFYGKEYVGCTEGDSNPKALIPYLIEMHSQGLLPLEKLVSCYDVKDYEKAIADMKSGKTIKPVLKWTA